MFKESFKYYKAKWPVPNFDEVVGFKEDVCSEKVRVSAKQNKNKRPLNICLFPEDGKASIE